MSDQELDATARRLARLYCELWSTGDANIVRQIFRPDARHVAGLEQPWDEFIRDLRTNFPDLERPLEHAYVEDDVLIIRTRMQGTHTGSAGYFQFPATGVRMDIPAVTAFRVRAGLLAEELWSEYDLASVEKSMTARVVADYLESVWGQGDLDTLKTHVASGHVLHLNGKENAVEGRRRLGQFVTTSRERWDSGAFQVLDCIAGGEWGERVAYRWSAAEPAEDASAVHGIGFARLHSGAIVEEWLQLA